MTAEPKSDFPRFTASYAEDDEAIASRLLGEARLPLGAAERINRQGRALIDAIRAGGGALGGVEEMLREYALSTREGLALMALAEALLRVPDAVTADQLIEDKLGQGDFAHHESKSDAWLVSASAWALGLSARIIQPGETPEGLLGQIAKRIGLPTLRAATRQAMRVMGNHFVLGQTILEAQKRAGSGEGRIYRYSFDMLGEGARTAEDAERYFRAYADAITAIGKDAGNAQLPDRPGISVKLSALHPRYEAVSESRVMAELVPRVIALARMAKAHDLNFTIDAEECDRLELSLDVMAAVVADASLAGWDGFGLAIQAYQKRALAVIDWIAALAGHHQRRLMVRLVKGAYWDTEVKRAQERGLPHYPVFTRKAMTDLHYEACARRLLAHRPKLYPQFATHNALTVATIIDMAGNSDGKERGYEFQRLHGMGEALYAHLLEQEQGFACRTYAPVGGHTDLLAYLVRRLLENGANSSFVSRAADPDVPADELLTAPADVIASARFARHPRLPKPEALYLEAQQRNNSAGYELGERATRIALAKKIMAAQTVLYQASPIIAGKRPATADTPLRAPADNAVIGHFAITTMEQADHAVIAARDGFAAWAARPVAERAAALEKAAQLLECETGAMLHLLQTEAGKTIDDAIAELREAVDFCRYYAADGIRLFAAPRQMPGPTGEENILTFRGRGPFVCIAPWNFPLAIFIGQVAAALMAGNTVVAKPAPQTPLIGALTVELMHQAGVPTTALQFCPGGGDVGARLVAHKDVAGVCFTGSTATARAINRALAAKDGPIVPLIAETGGINAMIVDATALPEQVADDVVMSAFRSAGQRCSALRLLLLQEDVADKMIEMIIGAAKELKLGEPRDLATHVGPVIDAAAKARLEGHIAAMSVKSRVLYAGIAPDMSGTFVAPHVIALDQISELNAEHFGPLLHVVRWKAGELGDIIKAIHASGYGLTLGVQSRIDATVRQVTEALPAGNVYVNRNIIGAVVGTQPFGGHGLSGTGPKAGGPNYLIRFAAEQTITTNTAAAGGNASLLAMEE